MSELHTRADWAGLALANFWAGLEEALRRRAVIEGGTMGQVLHPTLGISRPDGEWPRRCSKCAAEVPEDEVPLILFGGEQPSGHVPMWVIGDCCMDRPEITRSLNKRAGA